MFLFSCLIELIQRMKIQIIDLTRLVCAACSRNCCAAVSSFWSERKFCIKDGAQSFQMDKIRGLTGGYSFFEDGQKLRSRFVIHIGGYLATVIWQDWNKLRFESPKIFNTLENVSCLSPVLQNRRIFDKTN